MKNNRIKIKNDNSYKHRWNNKEMTLIIGARCKDGVILIGDKKVTEGTTSFPDKKITIMPFGVALSGAGMGDFFDKFVTRLNNYVNDKTLKFNEETEEYEPKEDVYEHIDDFLVDCENTLLKLKEDYEKRIYPNLSILMGIRSENEAELHYLETYSCIDSTRRSFMAIGSGSPYANFFLKELWDENLTMKQMAKIGVFIINYIADNNIDDAVGYGYQIVEVPDLFPNMKEGEGNIKEVKLNNETTEEDKIKNIINSFQEKVKKLKEEIIPSQQTTSLKQS